VSPVLREAQEEVVPLSPGRENEGRRGGRPGECTYPLRGGAMVGDNKGNRSSSASRRKE